MPHISIIVVNYNSAPLTTACLKSLSGLELTKAEYTVLIVDNGSLDPYCLPAAFAIFAQVIRSESNLGFTGGNNLGIHHALEAFNSDYVVLLNNDTVVAKDFLEVLLQKAEADPQLGLLCPKIYFMENKEFHRASYLAEERGKVIWFAGGSLDWPNLLAFHRGVDEVDRGQYDDASQPDFLTGCCLLIKREVLEKIGLLDKRYYMYFEDVELSRKAVSFGYSLGFCPEAKIWHLNAGSSDGSGSALHQYYQSRNKLLFFWEYGGWRTKLTVINQLLRFLVSNNRMESMAAYHFITRQFGKQPIV